MKEEEKKLLLKLARGVLERYFSGKGFELGERPELFKEKRGVFVSLHLDGELKGCIGYIHPIKSIYNGVKENALNAALRDPRFAPLSKGELKRVKIEISVLSKPVKLEFSSADELLRKLRNEVDGVILQKGGRQATFLPQVWEQIPDKVIFLEQLSLKAGLGRGGWRESEVYIYQAEVFGE